MRVFIHCSALQTVMEDTPSTVTFVTLSITANSFITQALLQPLDLYDSF